MSGANDTVWGGKAKFHQCFVLALIYLVDLVLLHVLKTDRAIRRRLRWNRKSIAVDFFEHLHKLRKCFTKKGKEPKMTCGSHNNNSHHIFPFLYLGTQIH